MRIAITGGIGSGKSTICQKIEQTGLWKVGYWDNISHQLFLKKETQNYIKHLRSIVYKTTDPLDVTKDELRNLYLGSKAFKDTYDQYLGEKILHTLWTEAYDIVEVPALYEYGLEKHFDYVIAIYCSQEEQIRRVMKRNNWGEEDVLRFINLQLPTETKILKADLAFNTSYIDPFPQVIKAIERITNVKLV